MKGVVTADPKFLQDTLRAYVPALNKIANELKACKDGLIEHAIRDGVDTNVLNDSYRSAHQSIQDMKEFALHLL